MYKLPIEKSQSQHMRTSKTGKVYSAGSGAKKTERKKNILSALSKEIDRKTNNDLGKDILLTKKHGETRWGDQKYAFYIKVKYPTEFNDKYEVYTENQEAATSNKPGTEKNREFNTVEEATKYIYDKINNLTKKGYEISKEIDWSDSDFKTSKIYDTKE